jgi:hypothetical protein
LWLNDRLGREVAVWIEVEQGDLGVGVLEADGELRHWSEEKEASRAAGREDIAGLYEIGGCADLNLSYLRPVEVTTMPSDPSHLIVRLDEWTTLEIVERDEDGD